MPGTLNIRSMLLPSLLMVVLWLMTAVPVFGGNEALEEQIEEILARIDQSPFGEPLLLDSSVEDGELRGEIFALVEHGFDQVIAALISAANWCEIIFLHLNVKACVHGEEDEEGAALIRIYMGRKEFAEPEDATSMDLELRVITSADDALEIKMTGAAGPHGTRNFRIETEAVPSGDKHVLVRFRYSLEISGVTRAAMGLYFATAGRDRLGFTTVNDDGEPVGGLRGMIERNVMRFYLGFQAYLDALDEPEAERLPARLERWYDLTERYPDQLRELDRDSYLSNKERERDQQEKL